MDAAAKLEQKIRDTIPLSAAMQFKIDALSQNAIAVSAPLSPNVNIHGTGFAGSIYSLAVLTGWALCSHMLEQMGIDADLVVAKAEIRYRAPVTDDLRCNTSAGIRDRETFLRDIRRRGKGLLALTIEVGDKPSAVLQASFCAIIRA